jgi:hypothetical protein
MHESIVHQPLEIMTTTNQILDHLSALSALLMDQKATVSPREMTTSNHACSFPLFCTRESGVGNNVRHNVATQEPLSTASKLHVSPGSDRF